MPFIFYVAFYSLFTSMQETLHMHNDRVSESFDPCDVLEASSIEISEGENITDVGRSVAPSQGNLLKNWPLMSTIIVYCVFSLQEMAYTEVSIFLACGYLDSLLLIFLCCIRCKSYYSNYTYFLAFYLCLYVLGLALCLRCVGSPFSLL